jgi:hypothetical protein
MASLPRASSPPPSIKRVTSPQVPSGSTAPVVVPSARSSLTAQPPETLRDQVTTLYAENASLKEEVKRLQALESSTSNNILGNVLLTVFHNRGAANGGFA